MNYEKRREQESFKRWAVLLIPFIFNETSKLFEKHDSFLIYIQVGVKSA